MKKVVIIGAGPAGLTAAYELLNKSNEYQVIIIEESNQYGGISKTINYKGNRMDIGGHRFFSKVPEVNDWWKKMLPLSDNYNKTNIMLKRKRISHILFNNKFFDYPVTLKFKTLKNMGFLTTINVLFSYLKSLMFKRKENSLEDFYINRFGKKLYSMFFENYTENLWGRHPRNISSDWGAQRVKGLSIKTIFKDIFSKKFDIKNRNIETSLIEEFYYPKYGPGQLWELTANKIIKNGGKIIKNAKVIKINKNKYNKISSLTYIKNGIQVNIKGDYFISSMPIKDLVEGMNNVPKKFLKIASGLPYRDYITMGVLVNDINFKNNENIVCDNWIYVHDKKVKMGRFQIYNNWSPYLVKNVNNIVWLGLEYFCNENDEIWNMTDKEFTKMGIEEMIKIGLIDDENKVIDKHIERVKKAYPAYFDTYNQIDELRNYLNTISNLFCIGRNGQHRYNNMDHSMCTAFETVNNILFGKIDKSNIWNINTEKEYHESKNN